MEEKSPRGEDSMRHYETIYIANPNLADEEYGEILTKFRDSVEKSRGVIIKTEEWGKQKLAYELKKFDSGFYVLTEYCGESGMTAELERNLKLDERILKYQTVKLADKADPEALIEKEKENREKSRLRAAEASEEETRGEAPEEGEVEEELSAMGKTSEEESEEETLVNAPEDPVDMVEVRKEDGEEGTQEPREAVDKETPSQIEGEIEDQR
jgi:small subunit ribosomal protein S6